MKLANFRRHCSSEACTKLGEERAKMKPSRKHRDPVFRHDPSGGRRCTRCGKVYGVKQ